MTTGPMAKPKTTTSPTCPGRWGHRRRRSNDDRVQQRREDARNSSEVDKARIAHDDDAQDREEEEVENLVRIFDDIQIIRGDRALRRDL